MATQKKTQIPTEGIVRIIPFPASMVVGGRNLYWGNESRSGVMSIGRERPWGTDIRDTQINGGGQILDMTNPEHQELLDIYLHSDQWKHCIAKSKDNKTRAARFYILNSEIEAEKYLQQSETADILRAEIRGMNRLQLERFGLIFGIKGTETVVRSKLRQMTDTEKGKRDLEEKMMSPDRALLELVYFAESVGDARTKQGLYKTQKGIWFWYETSLATSREGVILFLKGKEKENETILIDMKSQLNQPASSPNSSELIHPNPAEERQAQIEKQENDWKVEKVLKAWDSIQDSSEAGLKQIAFQTKVKRDIVEKILKENGKI